jgi:hypothetical protein
METPFRRGIQNSQCKTRRPIHALMPTSMRCSIGSRQFAAGCALVHSSDPEVSKTIKRTDRPYFDPSGNMCALLAAKDLNTPLLLVPGA